MTRPIAESSLQILDGNLRTLLVRFEVLVFLLAGLLVALHAIGPESSTLRSHLFETTSYAMDSEGEDLKGVRIDEEQVQDSRVLDFSELHKLERYVSEFSRIAALRKMLATASTSDLEEALSASQSIASKHWRVTAQTEIFRKFAVLDPEAATDSALEMAWNLRKPYISAIFKEWATLSVDDAVARAKTLSGADRRSAAEGLIWSRADLPFTVLRSIEQDLNVDGIATHMREHAGAMSAADDPESAWIALLADVPIGDLSFSTLAQIANLWINREGSVAVERVAETIEDWPTRTALISHMFRRLAETDPTIAFDLARKWYDDVGGDLYVTIVGQWAKLDPQSALDALQRVDSPYLRNRLKNTVYGLWAKNDPKSLLNSLGQVSSGMAGSAQRSALVALASTEPETSAVFMKDLTEYQSQVGFAIVNSWAKKDIHATLEWLGTLSYDKNLQRYLQETFWPYLIEFDLELAMQSALNQPVERNQVGLEVHVIRSVGADDIDLARSLLHQVREGTTQTQAFVEVGLLLVKGGSHEEAFDLATDLPESSRKAYYDSLAAKWAYVDLKGLTEVIGEIPVEASRSTAAMWLLTANHRRKAFTGESVLTDEQIEQVRTFLSEIDSRRVGNLR